MGSILLKYQPWGLGTEEQLYRLFRCNVQFEISKEKKHQPFKETGCLCKKKCGRPRVPEEAIGDGEARVLFEVHRNLRELTSLNLECPRKRYGKFYEKIEVQVV
ncbi:hypothetical protein TNCV_4461441 [Trichonephila clavipes]|nr:hypothetical protein TNCV_4461441 [Trichonephila clavipes]